MRALTLLLLGGLACLVGTASDAAACEACGKLFAGRKTMRGVLRPHVEYSTGLIYNVWAVPDSPGARGGAPAWKLEVDGRTYYLDLGGDKKLAELAAKLSGKEVEIVAREFQWAVIPTVVTDENGRTATIAPRPPYNAPGLRVFELRAR